MENPQYEQLKLFYTQEEVDAKVSEAVTDGVQALHRATSRVSSDLRDKAIEWFKSEVRGGSMIKEDALGIFNGLADALGWDLIDNLTSTYTVTVYFRGNEVGQFEGVEADDESDAESKVLDEMGVDASINLEIAFGDHTLDEAISIDSWDLSDDFTAEASEE